ncbi:MAG: serine/threonine-protein kinase [Planctomycetota bacterium]
MIDEELLPGVRGITILDQVGNGAGSVVFRARYERTGETVAVKSVTEQVVRRIQELAPSPEYGGNLRKLLRMYLDQVRNEWKIGHRLTNLAGGHIGIPRMHKLHVKRGVTLRAKAMHLVMDFVEGNNLRKGHGYSVSQLVNIYRQAADVLRFMHQHNVIHADMKPHHIIVTSEGLVQLLDLGLACHREGHTAQVVGSPSYMAPEQIVGAGVDERTDVFGLGATMFWALTGRTIRPNLTGSAVTFDAQIKNFETSVRDYNPECPPGLEDVILRSCSPSRSARLTLSEVVRRLDRLGAVRARSAAK